MVMRSFSINFQHHQKWYYATKLKFGGNNETFIDSDVKISEWGLRMPSSINNFTFCNEENYNFHKIFQQKFDSQVAWLYTQGYFAKNAITTTKVFITPILALTFSNLWDEDTYNNTDHRVRYCNQGCGFEAGVKVAGVD